MRNLTLAYGLRFDIYKVPAADKNSPFPFSRHFHTNAKNVTPRFGFAYGLGKNDCTVVHGSTGIFYDPPQTDLYRRAILNSGSSKFVTFTTIPGTPYAPAFPNVLPSLVMGLSSLPLNVTTISTDFATLYSYNANVSTARQLGAGFVATASYLYTKGTHLSVYANINLVPSGSFLADGRPIYSSAAQISATYSHRKSVGDSN